MFNVGDKIVYPTYGAGIIKDIKEMEVQGQLNMYYIMSMILNNSTVMIPVENSNIALRKVISVQEGQKVLDSFKDLPIVSYPNWNKRIRENTRKINSGDIYEVLQVLKDLMYRNRSKGLSASEKRMLNNAKQIIISELVLSTLKNQKEIEDIMTNTIEEMIAN